MKDRTYAIANPILSSVEDFILSLSKDEVLASRIEAGG